MLVAQNLVKRYGTRTVVQGVSLEVRPGEIVGLLGPNGAGKTTTFYMIMGLTRPDSGRVYLNGLDITNFPVHMRARAGIGYLNQEPSVFRGLTVEENILMVLEATGPKDPEESREVVDRLLEEFGLTPLRRQLGATLSGGERRRVEIARVLAMEPRFMLLDEPFTGIDPKSVAEIQEIVLYLRGKGIGLVITDHNVRDTLAITDRSYILYEGRILAAGTSGEILENHEARRIYLGDRFEM